ncbi:MAG TPA: thioredoxin family protein [Chitinophagaceae bacterium]|nr:thioredoxin family protein [Chitinophagaceae bacterium]
MKPFILAIACFFWIPNGWHYNLEEATQIAQREHKHILLNFSGSDWCGPCILMRREILDNPDFLKMADSALVLVNADFPRNKKDQLSISQQKINNAMADRYNPEGKFPFTLLLNGEGKVLKVWDGMPDENPEQFANEVIHIIARDHTAP